MRIVTTFVELTGVVDDLSIVRSIDDLYIDRISALSIEEGVFVIVRLFEQRYSCFINHTSVVTSFRRCFSILNSLLCSFTSFIVFSWSFDVIFLHFRFENRNDNSSSNSMYSIFFNSSSMSDGLQAAVIVVGLKTLEGNEDLTFHGYLLLIVVVLKDRLMLQALHQAIECRGIDASLLSKQFRAMFEVIQDHVKVHRSLEYKSRGVEVSKLIDVLHDLQRFFGVLILHGFVGRSRGIGGIQILCKFVDRIDGNAHGQQSLNAQFEAGSIHAVYVEGVLASVAKQQQLKAVSGATSRIQDFLAISIQK